MDGGLLARLRWRRRGAWMWPSFIVMSGLDGAIVHARPMAGDGQSLIGGIVLAMVFNVIAILLLSRPLGAVVRRRRTDMPRIIARDYGGTAAIGLITLIMLSAGLAHHATLTGEQHTLREAIARAEAFVGDHAPASFRIMAGHTNTYTIQSGQVYRTCVPDRTATRTYCVIVKPRLPFAQSVIFDGYEPNSLFAAGTN